MNPVYQKIAIVAAIALPLWNIPLIVRIIRRKSSQDFSVFWAVGVWTCLALMAPSGFMSSDIVWKVFNITNLVLFSFVVIFVFAYRKEK